MVGAVFFLCPQAWLEWVSYFLTGLDSPPHLGRLVRLSAEPGGLLRLSVSILGWDYMVTGVRGLLSSPLPPSGSYLGDWDYMVTGVGGLLSSPFLRLGAI